MIGEAKRFKRESVFYRRFIRFSVQTKRAAGEKRRSELNAEGNLKTGVNQTVEWERASDQNERLFKKELNGASIGVLKSVPLALPCSGLLVKRSESVKMEKLNLFNKILQTEVPLAMYTWLQLGGPAEYFAEPRSESELSDLLKTCFEEKVPVRVFGLGTNLLVSDLGVPGLVIRLSDPVFSQVEVNGPLLDVGAGTRLGRLITLAVHEGLAGLESFIGIPGTVGGAVMENISTSDGAIGEWVESLKIMTVAGEIHELSREEVVFGYRSCSLENAILLSVRFRLVSDQEKELARRLQKIWIVRKKTQPMGYQGVGRLFKNPRGQNASDLIEAVGLKGTRIGGAAVSDRDANFVLVEPECSCDDVKRLIRLIQTQVREQEDVDLEVELTIW